MPISSQGITICPSLIAQIAELPRRPGSSRKLTGIVNLSCSEEQMYTFQLDLAEGYFVMACQCAMRKWLVQSALTIMRMSDFDWGTS